MRLVLNGVFPAAVLPQLDLSLLTDIDLLITLLIEYSSVRLRCFVLVVYVCPMQEMRTIDSETLLESCRVSLGACKINKHTYTRLREALRTYVPDITPEWSQRLVMAANFVDPCSQKCNCVFIGGRHSKHCVCFGMEEA